MLIMVVSAKSHLFSVVLLIASVFKTVAFSNFYMWQLWKGLVKIVGMVKVLLEKDGVYS